MDPNHSFLGIRDDHCLGLLGVPSCRGGYPQALWSLCISSCIPSMIEHRIIPYQLYQTIVINYTVPIIPSLCTSAYINYSDPSPVATTYIIMVKSLVPQHFPLILPPALKRRGAGTAGTAGGNEGYPHLSRCDLGLVEEFSGQGTFGWLMVGDGWRWLCI